MVEHCCNNIVIIVISCLRVMHCALVFIFTYNLLPFIAFCIALCEVIRKLI